MAQILDKQGLQHYANKMCNADNRKVGTKSLPTALNEIDTAIDGFTNAFEKEYGTPVNMEITNNKNIFSVGTGNGIDKKDDVENSFTDIKISGNSLVNLIQEKNYLDWHVNYCGRKTTEGIFIGAGSKYANAASPNITTSTDVRCTIPSKKNTIYTLICDVKVLEGTSSEYTIVYNEICKGNTAKIKNGKNAVLIRSDESEQTGRFQIYGVIGDNGEGTINIRLSNIMILEGDYTNKSIPEYFEGIKSLGRNDGVDHKIDIWSLGINLFDFRNNCGYECGYSFGFPHETSAKLESLGNRYILLSNGFYFKTRTDVNHLGVGFYVKVEKHTNYTFSCSVKSNQRHSVKCQGVYSSEIPLRNYNTQRNLLFSNEVRNDKVNQTFDSSTFDYVFFFIGGAWEPTVTTYKEFEFTNIQLQKSNSGTEFDIYRNDKKQISLNKPLRGLPNGVKDTIEKINGEWKIIRRCGEVIFNGSQAVTGTSNLTTNSAWSKFGYQLEDCKDYSNVICDSLAYQTDKSGVNPDLGECVGCTNNMWKILFQIKKNNNVPSTVAEVNNYMKKNPKKIIYELINPIIEDIDPITLQCWKNGTISIVDEVIPVETIHTVALNKSAQIQKNIEELTSLRNRVKTLEEQYSKTTLNQAYETELLKLDMKLDNII